MRVKINLRFTLYHNIGIHTKALSDRFIFSTVSLLQKSFGLLTGWLEAFLIYHMWQYIFASYTHKTYIKAILPPNHNLSTEKNDTQIR